MYKHFNWKFGGEWIVRKWLFKTREQVEKSLLNEGIDLRAICEKDAEIIKESYIARQTIIFGLAFWVYLAAAILILIVILRSLW